MASAFPAGAPTTAADTRRLRAEPGSVSIRARGLLWRPHCVQWDLHQHLGRPRNCGSCGNLCPVGQGCVGNCVPWSWVRPLPSASATGPRSS
jgi:hypothetical protein